VRGAEWWGVREAEWGGGQNGEGGWGEGIIRCEGNSAALTQPLPRRQPRPVLSPAASPRPSVSGLEDTGLQPAPTAGETLRPLGSGSGTSRRVTVKLAEGGQGPPGRFPVSRLPLTGTGRGRARGPGRAAPTGQSPRGDIPTQSPLLTGRDRPQLYPCAQSRRRPLGSGTGAAPSRLSTAAAAPKLRERERATPGRPPAAPDQPQHSAHSL